MSDWVHCNTCFSQPGKASGRKFALTNCGHVYCDVCVNDCTKEKCKMCGARCSTITLSAKMKPDIEIFFSDPADIAKKQLKQLIQLYADIPSYDMGDRIMDKDSKPPRTSTPSHVQTHISPAPTVLDFQKSHRKRLTSFLRDKAQREARLLEQTQKSNGHIQDLEREVRKLRDENLYLKKLINDTGINPARHLSELRLNNAMQVSPSGTPSSGRVCIRTPPSHGKMGVIPMYEKTPNMK